MDYDKEYFQRRMRESKKKYKEASEAAKGKMRHTATWMAEKAKSENLSGLKPDDEYLFFYGSESVFSQWHKCNFIAEDLRFTCTEQYMMHRKAQLFSDSIIADKIMEAGYDPDRHKRLGRKVSGFVQKIWDKEKESIVYQGNYCKFTQNLALEKELINTAPKILVEASPVDEVWGIGLSIDDPRRFRLEDWKGKNLLGSILTRLREDLQFLDKSRGSI